MSNNGCIICNQRLVYSSESMMMECVLCKKSELSNSCCVNGHYVCDECHESGLNSIIGFCLEQSSTNPISILNDLMDMNFCHMHGPEHHSLVGASLLTAYSNAGGSVDLEVDLVELMNRSRGVPGGVCGYWGACGAGISAGIFVSVISKSTPLSVEPFSLSNRMTSNALRSISEHGGPRCCKRDSYLAILSAIDFIGEHFGITLDGGDDVSCKYSSFNKQCLAGGCPFFVGD